MSDPVSEPVSEPVPVPGIETLADEHLQLHVQVVHERLTTLLGQVGRSQPSREVGDPEVVAPARAGDLAVDERPDRQVVRLGVVEDVPQQGCQGDEHREQHRHVGGGAERHRHAGVTGEGMPSGRVTGDPRR